MELAPECFDHRSTSVIVGKTQGCGMTHDVVRYRPTLKSGAVVQLQSSYCTLVPPAPVRLLLARCCFRTVLGRTALIGHPNLALWSVCCRKETP